MTLKVDGEERTIRECVGRASTNGFCIDGVQVTGILDEAFFERLAKDQQARLRARMTEAERCFAAVRPSYSAVERVEAT